MIFSAFHWRNFWLRKCVFPSGRNVWSPWRRWRATSHKSFPSKRKTQFNQRVLWEITMTTFDLMAFFIEKLIHFNLSLFFYSHNTRTTQWDDPRIQAAHAALSHGNLFSTSEHSSVETLFSSPTQLSSLGSSNGKNKSTAIYSVTLKQNKKKSKTEWFKHSHLRLNVNKMKVLWAWIGLKIEISGRSWSSRLHCQRENWECHETWEICVIFPMFLYCDCNGGFESLREIFWDRILTNNVRLEGKEGRGW